MDLLQRDLVLEVERHWYTHKSWPNTSSLALKLNADIDDVEQALESREVQKSLELRGVNRVLTRQNSYEPEELDNERFEVALALSAIYDSKLLADKLEELEIPETQYRGWMQDPHFRRFVELRTEDISAEEMPEINRNLIKRASKGDLRATKLVLEMSGRLTKNPTTINVLGGRGEYIVQRLVEIIKTHVRDPDILMAISNDFDVVMGRGKPIENVIRGETLESIPLNEHKAISGGEFRI